MRPKARLSVVLPRAVGVRSSVELCQFILASVPLEDFGGRLAAALPPGFHVVSLEAYHHHRAAAARVGGVHYRIVAGPSAAKPEALSALTPAALDEAARRYTCLDELVVERIRPGQRRRVDVRTYVDSFQARPISGGVTIDFRARVTPLGTVRPEEMVRVVGGLLGVDLVPGLVERTAIDLE
jgi:hypothetical protein